LLARELLGLHPAELERARVMLVGEQPGDREDREGKPFVGPAGRILDKALEEAGIERGDAYVTNVVKHFKWTPRGKRRIHQTPKAEEIKACAPWIENEIAIAEDPVQNGFAWLNEPAAWRGDGPDRHLSWQLLTGFRSRASLCPILATSKL